MIDLKKFREMCDNGATQQEICDYFGISNSKLIYFFCEVTKQDGPIRLFPRVTKDNRGGGCTAKYMREYRKTEIGKLHTKMTTLKAKLRKAIDPEVIIQTRNEIDLIQNKICDVNSKSAGGTLRQNVRYVNQKDICPICEKTS